jgi:hypothetical protein
MRSVTRLQGENKLGDRELQSLVVDGDEREVKA